MFCVKYAPSQRKWTLFRWPGNGPLKRCRMPERFRYNWKIWLTGYYLKFILFILKYLFKTLYEDGLKSSEKRIMLYQAMLGVN
jgi:hypothetical protein